MAFQLKIWDHCRYVKNRGKPYDEMARHLETMAGAGISASIIYMPEVISLDDYCRAAEQAGMAVEARISPAWGISDPVRRTLPDWIRLVKKTDDVREESFEGIACQKVADAIRTCRGTVMKERLLEAIDEAARQGLVDRNEYKNLKKEFST